ncbi:unnamed protein product [Heligmosomoides polygyrus]|uniref:Pept_C1 domain-containing protein n=1 Tax=Heligmosomoides polygyrus TaxID=6339 RepID=A0A183FQZ9_HELPZ|nr:unnamed protein product [Heligmosomoides polygyrus]
MILTPRSERMAMATEGIRQMFSLRIRNILKKELLLFGPTTMAFPVSEEFLHYSSGIFRPYPADNFEKRIVYWHVVRLIGWGQGDDGSHYWIAINSFGEHWGDSDFGNFTVD